MNNPPIKFGRLIIHTLAVGILSSVVGFLIIMTWGLSAQAGEHDLVLTIAGIVGYIVMLPTMLLGYALEGAKLGDSIGTAFALMAQFIGYFGVVLVLHIWRRMLTQKQER